MILEHIRSPADLKKVPPERLGEVAQEIREKILQTVTKNGGHLGSGMGVVELTIALHYLYDFSHDRLFLDTGHQCYPHKLLTGRYDRFHTLRTFGGISGFPNIDECPEFDLMTSGHAGTAISMALGACLGDQLDGNDRRTVAVVGDASIVSGMSFEALNCAGHLDSNLLVILNANEQSIGKTTGALARQLSKMRMSRLYLGAKEGVQRIERLLGSLPVIGDRMEKMDKGIHELADQVMHALVPGQLFESLGFRYFGVYDGHSIDTMLDVLRTIQDQPGLKLLHVNTVKGKGVVGCEEDPLAMHGAKPGDRLQLHGQQACAIEKVEPERAADPGAPPTKKKYDYARCFAEAVLDEAEKRPELVAISAGMPDGCGLVPFRERYPGRFFNVGIAEQHGVGLAGGLTIGGRRPVFVVYSTFLQRGFDNVFQEVALQRRPVVFMLSHGGVAGEDGPTHHGLFDISMLRAIPGVTLMAPRDGAEMLAMFRFALDHDGPVAIRYPKASTPAPTREVEPIQMGRSEILREGGDAALLGYGAMAETALQAAELLREDGIDCMVANPRFARPLDIELLTRVLGQYERVFTIEDGTLNGGFGSAVLEWGSHYRGLKARVVPLGVPDRFIEHGERDILLKQLGLDAAGIRQSVLSWSREASQLRTAP